MRIKYEEGICSECGLPKLITQKSLCLCTGCNQKRLTKRYNENKKKRYTDGRKADKEKLQTFYRQVWDSMEGKHICYESSSQLWKFNKWHVHHVLDKESYPDLAFNIDVCVLLTLEQHALWHNLAPSDRRKKMPKTYSKYLELLKKYDKEKYESEINSGIESY